MNELIPAILVQDEKTFRERLALIEGVVETVQLDVMDGAFVPNRTWFDADVLHSLSTPVHFELHLMVQDPVRYVQETCTVADTISRFIWHVEAQTDHAALIAQCHSCGKQAGLAINPTTPIDTLAPYADELDEILVMGAEPGFSGQALQPATVEKARAIHARWPSISIGFDISVNAETIPMLAAAGVTRFCAAGAIWKAADPAAEVRRLIDLLNTNSEPSS